MDPDELSNPQPDSSDAELALQSTDSKAGPAKPAPTSATISSKAPKKKKCPKCKEILLTNLLTLLTIFGVASGIGLGFVLKSTVKPEDVQYGYKNLTATNSTTITSKKIWSSRQIAYVGFTGRIFLNILECIIVPLITSSIIAAIANLDLSLSRKIGLKGMAYYMGTTVIAIIIGCILVGTIKPGNKADKIKKNDGLVDINPPKTFIQDVLMDLLRSFFPPNIIGATFEREVTFLENDTSPLAKTPKNEHEWKIVIMYAHTTNLLGLIIFAIAVGIAGSKIGPLGKPFRDFIQSLADTITTVTGWIVWLSPLGACFLVASEVVKAEDFGALLKNLAWYFLTVIMGLIFHGLIVLPLLFFLITWRLPFRFVYNMMPALLTAFGTASSSGTLPLTLDCLEKKNGVDERVSRFLVPIGSTVNLDGTALYEAVAVLYLAQLRDIPLGIEEYIIVSITATMASIGAAGTPGAGLVTMVIVLDSIGLEKDLIGQIIAVDWLLDRFRTAINVMGDSIVAGAICYTSQKELQRVIRRLSLESKATALKLNEAAAPDKGESASVAPSKDKLAEGEMGSAENKV